MSAAAHDYPLTRDDAEHARLAQQAAFWSHDAAALFDSAGIAPGQAVADLGCGTLHVARLLAQRVGPQGRVHALDSDAALVEAMRRSAHDAPRLSVERGDAYATGWPAASLDAVHARFLAAPAGGLDRLVLEMQRLVRPGGLLLLQEPIADSWQVPADHGAWPRMLALIRAGFAARGGDFDAGRMLRERLVAAGVRDVRCRAVAHTLDTSHHYARLPLAFCRSLSALWRSIGMASAEEIDDLQHAIERALDAPGGAVVTFTVMQVWGRRPGAALRTRQTAGPEHPSTPQRTTP